MLSIFNEQEKKSINLNKILSIKNKNSKIKLSRTHNKHRSQKDISLIYSTAPNLTQLFNTL